MGIIYTTCIIKVKETYIVHIATVFYQLITVPAMNFMQVRQLTEILVSKLCVKHKFMAFNLVATM